MYYSFYFKTVSPLNVFPNLVKLCCGLFGPLMFYLYEAVPI